MKWSANACQLPLGYCSWADDSHDPSINFFKNELWNTCASKDSAIDEEEITLTWSYQSNTNWHMAWTSSFSEPWHCQPEIYPIFSLGFFSVHIFNDQIVCLVLEWPLQLLLIIFLGFILCVQLPQILIKVWWSYSINSSPLSVNPLLLYWNYISSQLCCKDNENSTSPNFFVGWKTSRYLEPCSLKLPFHVLKFRIHFVRYYSCKVEL